MPQKRKRLFILVEGNDDARFFSAVVVPRIKARRKYASIEIWKYAQRPMRRIRSFIDWLDRVGADYIFVHDMDEPAGIAEKKRELASRLGRVNMDKMEIVVLEIESWYLAGVDTTRATELGLPEFAHTEDVRKEDFISLLPRSSHQSKIDMMMEMLKGYSVASAVEKNISFKMFGDKYLGLKRK